MKLIKQHMYSFVSFILILFMITVPGVSADVVEAPQADVAPMSHSINVTYFHTTARCPTCHKIEALSSQAVNSNFENELKTGNVVWRVINVDEPENKHYNTDYQLYTKSLIVSEVKDGKEVRWKNLEKIWTFVRDEEKFDAYVNAEVKDWLKE
jgi:hypothetical protein